MDEPATSRTTGSRDLERLRRRVGELEGQIFVSLVENSTDLIGIATLSGEVLYLNPAGRNLVGLDGSPSPARFQIRDFAMGGHVGKLGEALASLLETGTWKGEARIRHFRNGEPIPVETRAFLIRDPESGAPIAMATISRDLTEGRRVENALRLSEEKFSKAFLISPDSVNINRFRDGMFIDVNEGFCRLTGYAPGEVIGRTSLELNIWARPGDRAEMAGRLSRHGEVRNFEAKFLAKDGRVLTGLLSARKIDMDGETCILSITRDITDRARLEEQLRQAQKMEAVGRLAGGIAHDFNNLLSAVVGYSDLLLSRLGPGDPSSSELIQIRKAGESASALTRQLLAFSRKQVLDLRPTALNGLVTDMERMLRRVIGEDIGLATRLDPGLGTVRADRNQVEQVLMNLAVNARDAMPEGGTLAIGTRNVTVGASSPARPPECSPGPYVLLSVEDTGQGMDEETKGKIFEPFFTTKGTGKGTGLGLSTVHGIVRQSGGFVEVATAPGLGTTFNVYLPRVEEEADPVPAAAGLAGTPGGSETLLLVEDSGVVREYVLEILRMGGYSILEAASGEEALRATADHPGAIDLLVTDVVMPGMNGKDLADRLSASRPGLKVLFMSGYPDDAIVDQGAQGKEVHFLGKPFRPDAMLRKVRQILEA